MLRPQKLRGFERTILWGIGLLLCGAGLVGALFAFQAAHWRFAAVSLAAVGVAILYFCAARRGKPL